MNRTIAGRTAPSWLPWPPTHGSRALGGRSSAGSRGGRSRGTGGTTLGPAGEALGALLGILGDRRRLRVALLSMVAALPILGVGWMWFRSSPFVTVRDVEVSGVHGVDAREIEAQLVKAGRQMSTLDVHPSALIAAVAQFRVVRAVHVSASFPHTMRIEVEEQLPVAAVQLGGIRTAVAADGAVLGPALLSSHLPSVSAGPEGSEPDALTGQYVRSGTLMAELTILGAEPAPFSRSVKRVFSGPKGITVAMRSGLLVFFGDGTLPHAKWLSLARVLLDSSSAGASYIDVRVPERPAAGFPAGMGPQTSGTEGALAGAGPTSASEPTTTAELAAGLEAALGTSPSPSTGTSPAGPASSAAAATATGAAATAAGGQTTTSTGSVGDREASAPGSADTGVGSAASRESGASVGAQGGAATPGEGAPVTPAAGG